MASRCGDVWLRERRKNSILFLVILNKRKVRTIVENNQFIKNERKAFIWVNVGCILLLIGLMVWKYCPAVQAFSTPCVFHEILHLYCPGCGGTRAVYALLHFHFLESVGNHPIVLFVAIIFAEYYVGAIITLIRNNGKRYYYLRTWFCYVALGIVVVNAILRNVLLVYFQYDYIGDLLYYWK